MVCCGKNHAREASVLWSMTGSCLWSIHPLFQSILGWNTANQGYPRITLFSSRLDRKNHRVDHCIPVCICTSVKYWSSPLRFGVPSTLYNFLGSLRHLIGICRYLAYSRFIKFSIAPESSRVIASALFDLEWMNVRMVMDFLFDTNTFEVWVHLISADLIKQG